jgi:CBS domain-containing protein
MLENNTAKQAMSKGLVTFREDMDILEAVRILIEKRISGAPVTDRLGNLVGMLTERDCLQIALDAGYHSHNGGQVSGFMTKEVKAIESETPVMEIAELFAKTHYRRLPILDHGRLIGMISRRDVLKLLSNAWQHDTKRA